MNLDRTRLMLPRPRVSWFVLLGIVLLIGSVLGARESFQSAGTSTAEPTTTETDLPAGGSGYVDIVGGVTNMYPLVTGRVTEVLAHDGDVVEKGTPLFKIDDTLAVIDLNRARVAVTDAELKVRGARNKVKQHEALNEAQVKVIEGKRSQVKIAEAQVAEAKRRFESGSIGIEKVHQAEEAVRGSKAELGAEEAKQRALQADDPIVLVQQAENNLKEQQQLVQKAQFGVDECTVKAPAKGEVLRILVAVGDPLSANPRQPALQFAIGKRIIRAEIDQEFAANIHVGQVAEVQDDTRSNGPGWSGKVTRVSDWYAPKRSMISEPLHFNDVRTLEVIVDLDHAPLLRIGQRVRVMLK